MTEVRPFTSGDVATVAALFQRTFRDGRGPAPAALAEHLESVFLHHPWQDPEVASRVHVNAAGTVNGFIGVMPLRLRLGISDGQNTELIEGDLKEGAEVVTNVAIAGQSTRPATTAFPGFGPPGGRQGFGGGGGFNGGGGGRGR